MNIAFEKAELIKRLDKVQDVSLLKAIKNLLDFGLSKQDEENALEQSISRALEQSKNNEVRLHSEVMEEIRNKYEA